MESEISFAGIAPATPARPPFLTQSLASDSVRYGPPPGPSRTCLRFYILVSRQPRTRPLSLANADQRSPELSGATFSVLTLSASEDFCVKLANVAQLWPALTNDRQRLSAPNFPFNAVSIQRFLCEVGVMISRSIRWILLPLAIKYVDRVSSVRPLKLNWLLLLTFTLKNEL